MASIELGSGTVVDVERGTGYLMAPGGGVTAIALKDGHTLWHSEEADKPLLLADGLLLSQAQPPATGNGVRIRMLSVGAGGSVARESVVPLPGNVDPAIEPTGERNFSIVAEQLDGDAVLRWEFRERPLKGTVDGPDEVLPGESPDEVGSPLAPAMTMDMRFGDSGSAAQQEGSETVMRGQVRLSPADGTVRPMVEPFVEHEPMAVPQFASPRFSMAPETPPPAPGGLAPILSSDGRHEVHSEPAEDDGALEQYRWIIYTRGGAEEVGSVVLHVGFAPFVVSEGRMIVLFQPFVRLSDSEQVEEPMQLKAIDLASGDVLWTKPVRDVHAIPVPPS